MRMYIYIYMYSGKHGKVKWTILRCTVFHIEDRYLSPIAISCSECILANTTTTPICRIWKKKQKNSPPTTTESSNPRTLSASIFSMASKDNICARTILGHFWRIPGVQRWCLPLFFKENEWTPNLKVTIQKKNLAWFLCIFSLECSSKWEKPTRTGGLESKIQGPALTWVQ